MNERELLQDISGDLQLAPARKVVYLEGKSDVAIFFALLGVATPPGGLHQGVLVRGLSEKRGSGGEAVESRTSLAASKGYSGVFGIVDGDGESLSKLAERFDAPYAGPCFSWKVYCIENLLVKACWPEAWEEAPIWGDVLRAHSPYVALNRLHKELRESLETLKLFRFSHPTLEEPLRTRDDVAALLARDKHLIAGYDVEARFFEEVRSVEALIDVSLDEGHALVNGKWLVNVFAPRHRGLSWHRKESPQAWITAAAAQGGLPEVRDLWRRITGRLP